MNKFFIIKTIVIEQINEFNNQSSFPRPPGGGGREGGEVK